MRFSPDGSFIASAGAENQTVKIKRRDGTDVASYKDTHGNITGVALSPDGQAIAIANVEKIAQIWRINSPKSQILKGHKAEIWQVVFSPNGKMVATGSGDNTVKLWTVDGKLLQTFKGHTAAVWGVAFSPDSQIIASGSVDATIKLWKLDGTEITTLRGHTAAIRKIAISRDGTFLASGGDDNTLNIWNLPQILKLNALADGCAFVQDYLQTNTAVAQRAIALCANSTMSHSSG
ncbi:WD40 repeat domain-containing protein [Fortiea contorta]|uniref:WD40 repeat domain-containing protein n=1 Tax=Fortiea contorta TaxID=1892405 RepID=UPI000348A96F|nr:WD40 repeat domain-containing protein [Fortiea contorta]